MADQNSIKTIMSIDNKDITEKLKQLEQHYKATFSGWIEATDKLKLKDQELISAKNSLAISTKALREEQSKGSKANKDDVEILKQAVATHKDSVKVLTLEKNALSEVASSHIREMNASKQAQVVAQTVTSAKKEQERAIKSLIDQKHAEIATTAKENATLKEQYTRLYENTKATNAYNDAVAKLNVMRERGVITQEQYNRVLAKERDNLRNSAPERDNQFNHFIRMARWGGTLVGVYYAVSVAWGATIGKGIELGRQLEDMTMGVTALTAANASNITSTGQLVTPMEKFRMAMVLTTDTMRKLKKVAAETPGSFADIAGLYQQAYAQTSGMGDRFGKDLAQIQDNTITLTKRTANIVGSIGMEMFKGQEEIRSLLSGNASNDSLIARLLFGSPSQANEAIKKAKEQGTNAVSNLVLGLTEAYAPLEKFDTYTKSLNNMQAAYGNMWVELAKPIKNDLASVFDKITKSLDTNTTRGKKNVEELSNAFNTLYERIKNSVNLISVLAKPIVATLTLSGEGWSKIFDLMNRLDKWQNGRIGTLVTDLGGGAPLLSKLAIATKHQVSKNSEVGKLIEGGKIPKLLTDAGRDQAVAEYNKQMERLLSAKETIDNKFAYLSDKREAALVKKDAQRKMEILAASIKRYDTQPKAVSVSNKGSLTSSIDQSWLQPTQALIQSSPSGKNEEMAKLRKTLVDKIAEYQKAITTLSKDGITKTEQVEINNAKINIETARKGIAELDRQAKEQAIANGKRVQTEANQITREQIKAFEFNKVAREAELAQLIASDAVRNDQYALDESRMSARQKKEIANFDSTILAYADEFKALSLIGDETERQHKQHQLEKDLYEVINSRAEYRLGILQKQTDELDRQTDARERLSIKEYEADIKFMELQSKRNRETPAFERTFGMDKISNATADAQILEASNRFNELALGLRDEALAKETDKFNNYIETIKNKIAEVPPIELELKLAGWDVASSAFANTINSMVALRSKNEKYNEQVKAAGENTALIAKLDAQHTSDQLEGYGSMANSVKAFAKEGTLAFEAVQAVEKGMYIARMAMQLEALSVDTAVTEGKIANSVAATGVKTTEAIAGTAASVPFPFNIAAVATIVALLASYGAKSSGGGAKAVDYTETIKNASFTTGQGVSIKDYSGNFEKFIEGLDSAAKKLEGFGSTGSALSDKLAAITTTIRTYQDQLAPIMDKASKTTDFRTLIELNAQMIPFLQSLYDAKTELNTILTSAVQDSLDYSKLSEQTLSSLTSSIDMNAYEATLSSINELALKAKGQGGELTDADKQALIDFYTLPNFVKAQDYQGAIEAYKSLLSDQKDNLQAQVKNALELKALQDETYASAIDNIKSLSDSFVSMGASLTSTIESLTGKKTGANSTREMIAQFWDKQTQTEALLAKNGDLTATESQKLQSLVSDLSNLSTSIQSATVGDNTSITGSLVTALSDIQHRLDFTDTILKVRLVDNNGTAIEVGALSQLASSSTSTTLGLSDFTSGGSLSNAKEILFRNSFTSETASTYSDELSNLRDYLSYLAIGTPSSNATFLQQLQHLDSIGLGNVKEFYSSIGATLPSFAVGSSGLPTDMIAQVHKGEMIIDPQSSDVLRRYGIPTHDYLGVVMDKVYSKIDEMTGYLKRLDQNIDSAMFGKSLRTIQS